MLSIYWGRKTECSSVTYIMSYKIAFLIDKTNNWIENFLKKRDFKNKSKYKFKIFDNYLKIKNYDVIFIIGYSKIIDKNFLEKNKYNLVVHESNLPKGKGFAPVQWQVLKNKKKIPICIIKAEDKVDSGNIVQKTFFKLDGTELHDEIREKQAKATFNIIERFLKKFPKIFSKKQIGKSTFYRKRYPEDNLLNINKSIKENFNLLRISNNERFPSHFYYKSKKYIIKIFKEHKLIGVGKKNAPKITQQLVVARIIKYKLNDARFLLRVHNYSVKGGFFTSQSLITLKDHIKWLKLRLKSKKSQIYVGKKNKIKFGYVRFDKIKNRIYEISIANLPNYYSKGLGTKLLNLSLRKFIKKHNPKKITAVIRKFNVRSQKCFLKNNFKKVAFNKKKHITIIQFNMKQEYYYEHQK